MRYPLYLGCFLITACIAGCGGGLIKNNNPENADTTHVADAAGTAPARVTKNVIIDTEEDLPGYWVGLFEPVIQKTPENEDMETDEATFSLTNKINLSIDAINGDSVKGHSVVAGNNRPISGTVIRDGSMFKFVVKEPGDDKYDGVFTFTTHKGDSVLDGYWQANNKIKVRTRTYKLKKKFFYYDANWKLNDEQMIDWNKTKKTKVKTEDGGGEYDKYTYFTTTDELGKYNPSAEALTDDQVANMKKGDLFVLRNSIYARHGYTFKSKQLRSYFDDQNWYIPLSTDVQAQLTPLEKKNIVLLKRYEKNAKEYYQEFGR